MHATYAAQDQIREGVAPPVREVKVVASIAYSN